jgi:hypothetical protein
VGIQDERLEALLIAGAAKPPGMSQLQPNQQVVRVPAPGMGAQQFLAQGGNGWQVGRVNEQLVGVGASIRPNSNGFAAPNEFGPALSESLLAAGDQFGGAAIGVGIPAFHGLDAPAVGKRQRALGKVENKRPGKRRSGCGQKVWIKIERDAERADVLDKLFWDAVLGEARNHGVR